MACQILKIQDLPNIENWRFGDWSVNLRFGLPKIKNSKFGNMEEIQHLGVRCGDS